MESFKKGETSTSPFVFDANDRTNKLEEDNATEEKKEFKEKKKIIILHRISLKQIQ